MFVVVVDGNEEIVVDGDEEIVVVSVSVDGNRFMVKESCC